MRGAMHGGQSEQCTKQRMDPSEQFMEQRTAQRTAQSEPLTEQRMGESEQCTG
jgi:hypothetical protein